MPKAGSDYICLAVIIIDCALKKSENYYPQVFLKQCNYIEKEKKVINWWHRKFFWWFWWRINFL